MVVQVVGSSKIGQRFGSNPEPRLKTSWASTQVVSWYPVTTTEIP